MRLAGFKFSRTVFIHLLLVIVRFFGFVDDLNAGLLVDRQVLSCLFLRMKAVWI